MRLPPHVVRRRQGLYLRLRLPPDLARISGRTHVVRSLGTGDPGRARALAARASAALHGSWDDVRVDVTGTLRGVPVERVTAADVRALMESQEGEAALAALSPADAEALAQRVRDLTAAAARDVAAGRDERERLEWLGESLRDARRQGQVDGMREALAAGAGERRPRAHADADVPWSTLTGRFLASRPGLSPATLKSYAQAFREWKEVVGDKHLSSLTARDVALYSEFLENKRSNKGSLSPLNRKTIVRLTGHVHVFTSWAKSSGLVSTDLGEGIKVRERTREEKVSQEEGSKRAFTPGELEKLFGSPLFMGCVGRPYRARPGPHVFRDARWWVFVVGLLTGARVEELADTPSELVDLGGVTCLDLYGTKSPSARRLVPLVPALTDLGFVAFAEKQRLAGRKMFEGPGTSKDWSKWTNRYIDKILGADNTVSFHSLRHVFRQACSAAALGDYLCDKLLGHRSKQGRSEGSGYGRHLSPAEARLVVDRWTSPVPLSHLVPRPARRPAASHLP